MKKKESEKRVCTIHHTTRDSHFGDSITEKRKDELWKQLQREIAKIGSVSFEVQNQNKE